MERIKLPTDYHTQLIKIPKFRKVKRVIKHRDKIPMASSNDYVISFTYFGSGSKEFYLIFERDVFQKRYRRVYLVDKDNPTKINEWGSLEVFSMDELKTAVLNMQLPKIKGRSNRR